MCIYNVIIIISSLLLEFAPHEHGTLDKCVYGFADIAAVATDHALINKIPLQVNNFHFHILFFSYFCMYIYIYNDYCYILFIIYTNIFVSHLYKYIFHIHFYSCSHDPLFDATQWSISYLA